MRLLVLSDLHLEMWGTSAPRFDVVTSMPDLVILAGDIHTKARAPAWAAESFPGLPVLYVAGNHEFYGATIEGAGDAIRKECERFPDVHYLDCDEYMHEGVRFLGATLWSDFALFGRVRAQGSMRNAQAMMNDYRKIRVASDGYRRLNPEDTVRLHDDHCNWLNVKLAATFHGSTVVLTHMAPSLQSVPSKYATDLISAAYASNLDHLVEKADIWVHGHTHTSLDYRLGRCRVVANPLGYLMRGGNRENENFASNLVVEVETKY